MLRPSLHVDTFSSLFTGALPLSPAQTEARAVGATILGVRSLEAMLLLLTLHPTSLLYPIFDLGSGDVL